MLVELMGSRLRAKALGWLFSHPDERFFVRQLQVLLTEDSTNLSRELARRGRECQQEDAHEQESEAEEDMRGVRGRVACAD